MSGIVGDKIGFTAPTVGADLNVWGASLNLLWALMDEFGYAAREDRNNAIVGGGKIAWDGSDLTFAANIEVRNHITAYKNTITTAASPISLSTAHQVAYVQITRKPGSDQNITSATVVAAGSLPNGTTDADMGTFVLAYRTADGTVMLPWANKELLSGDHWCIGNHQTWLERIASSRKPGFYCHSDVDASIVTIEASASTPASVFIDGKLYVNTSDLVVDLDTAGRNGLDTGTKAADTCYYLYAIPATSGRGFDAVLSATVPATGPTGFSSRSYCGAAATDASITEFKTFKSAKGLCHYNDELTSDTTAGGGSRTELTLTSSPVTMKAAYFQLLTTTGVGGQSVSLSGTDSSDDALLCRCSVTGYNGITHGWVPILTEKKVWATPSSSTGSVVQLYGWQEDPMEYA